jgi:hypothetical protein
MRIKHTYGDCMSKYADGGKVGKKKGKRKAKPSMLGSGAAAQAGERLSTTREKQMKDLGLRDGGKPKMKKPEMVKPKRITTDAPPGGYHTPGAKKKRKTK